MQDTRISGVESRTNDSEAAGLDVLVHEVHLHGGAERGRSRSRL